MQKKILILSLFIFSSNIWASNVTANWMERLYRDNPEIKLRDIIIPGTHDSATHKIHRKSPFPKDAPGFFKVARKTVAKMSKTQNKNVYHQLINGIRYLDLRVTEHEGKLVIVHGMISVDLEEVLKDIKKFSDNFPKEIVIVDFQKMPEAKFYPQLDKLIKKYLKDRLFFEPVSPSNLTFDHFWNSRKSILAIWDAEKITSGITGYFKRSEYLKSDWANTTKPEILKNKLETFFKKQDMSKLFCGYFTLTPDTKYIISGIFSKRNIYKLNQEIFRAPAIWLPEWYIQGLKMNIVAVDFEDESNLVSTILQLNLKDLSNRY